MSHIQLLAAGPSASGTESSRALPHVLFIVDGFPQALGGGERIVLRLASLLPEYGFRASILTFALHPQSSFRPEEAPCPVYLLPLTNTYGLSALRGAFALRRFLREQQVCLVQTFFESSDLWGGLVTRLFSPAKLVWSRRDMGILRQAKHSFAYRRMRRLPHAVFAVSGRVAEHVITVDGVPASRVHVLHNGLDVQTLQVARKPLSPNAAVVTTIGNIRRVKGHDLLVAAAPAVLAQFPNTRFTIAGEILEQNYFEELQRMIAELGLGERFFFLGKVTDMREHLSGASLFVLPSRSEGFSNSLIEAMAAALPSVATDVGGNAEAIQDGTSGLIIAPEDVPALSDAILHLLQDPRAAATMGIAARQTVASRFSADAMMRQVVRTYRALLRA